MSATLDTGSMKVTRWVIHEIPKVIRDRADVRPKLSEIVSPYDTEVARFFERKISESLTKSKHEIQSADDERPVPILIAGKLIDPDDALLDASTSLAGELVASKGVVYGLVGLVGVS
ncbi:hypothetical protein [[Mycobacterium] vasticus]|uniref:Uncharacterized protein n=1 Tax=[Mycobacterium] vasticus TaxID=2875777 RepID=A0ABU5Z3U4_9MYCO|nr:hypothetical protein [Mycolicibacter sp. MYC017]MEB3072069.1 hypothetical protein [Mycolicibacter sp. MYC017]